MEHPARIQPAAPFVPAVLPVIQPVVQPIVGQIAAGAQLGQGVQDDDYVEIVAVVQGQGVPDVQIVAVVQGQGVPDVQIVAVVQGQGSDGEDEDDDDVFFW
ncbi:hypothetical protein FOA52_006627 [Chlamydomonas sp. UWO 241]|nr:hypothetical protein FOA52_006627 [Chlamydomonas sp. UWO 241]